MARNRILSKPCTKCNGLGKIFKGRKVIDCTRCNGTGKITKK